MQPTLGRIVHYTLTEDDAKTIRIRRNDYAEQVIHPGISGNEANAGDTYPATVVRNFGGDTVNLQVQLDGYDTYWATSRKEGQPGEHGRWIWPPRV